ncbi:MAG: hypothetical protein EOO74_07120 [Myxococcales bacterium]|nr:MAG: hypothetical protein EOO74_07120 [Myxococcales bacterium]
MNERGSITPLVIGFTVMLVMLVGVVVNASAAFLKRQQLNSLADAAALAATEGVEGEQVYTGGLGERAEIDPAVARARAADQLLAAGVAGLRFRIVTRTDSVTVHLDAPIDLPFRIGDLGQAVMISGSGTGVVTVSE